MQIGSPTFISIPTNQHGGHMELKQKYAVVVYDGKTASCMSKRAWAEEKKTIKIKHKEK